MLRFVAHGAAIVFLLVVSQIGGFAYLIVLAVGTSASRTYKLLTFVGAYTFLSVSALWIAPQFGRVPIACFPSVPATFKMQSPIYCLLNRQYVTPRTKALLNALSKHVSAKYPQSQTLVLDANFPFIDGFPLIPHLSHSDGRKVDVAFYYRDENGKYLRGITRSPIGYWGFEEPGENYRPICPSHNGFSLRWDMAIMKPFLRNDFVLDEKRMVAALNWLVREGGKFGLQRLYLEPHLVGRLKLEGDVIGFQGCSAARHDDHMHLQTR